MQKQNKNTTSLLGNTGAPKAPKAVTTAENDEGTSSSIRPAVSQDSETSVETIRNVRSTLQIVKSNGGPRGAVAKMLNAYHSMSLRRSMLSPDLVPLCRILVSSTLALFNGVVALQQGTTTYVADPSGNATNALGVFQWSTRFSGFQQYRLRNTEWKLVPLRNFETTTGSTSLAIPSAGYTIAFVEDDPQAGAASQAVALASYPRARVVHNSSEVHTVSYPSNEPSDLDLSDINTPPNKIVNGSVHQGGHCLNLYTDNGFFGFASPFGSGTIALIGVQAIYDVEFFGIGGV